MVSRAFINSLISKIHYDYRFVQDGHIDLRIIGNPKDQYKGTGHDIAAFLIPFYSESYNYDHLVRARIPIDDPYISFIDFITAVADIQGCTVQHYATFLTVVPHPVRETALLRQTTSGPALVPASLVEKYGKKISKGLKNEKLPEALLAINGIRGIRRLLITNTSLSVQSSIGPGTLEFSMPQKASGNFTVIPYKGSSILVSREAGRGGARMDEPSYNFGQRFEAFRGVASQIGQHPESGEDIGRIEWDLHLVILLANIIPWLEKGIDQPGQGQRYADPDDLYTHASSE